MSRARDPGQPACAGSTPAGWRGSRRSRLGNGTDWDIKRQRIHLVDSVTQRMDV